MSHPDQVIAALHRELTAQSENSAWWGLGGVPPWADSAISTIRAVVQSPDEILFSTSHLEGSQTAPAGYIAVITSTHLLVANIAGTSSPAVSVTRLADVGTVTLNGGRGLMVPDQLDPSSPGQGVFALVNAGFRRDNSGPSVRVAIPSGDIPVELQPRLSRALHALLNGQDS